MACTCAFLILHLITVHRSSPFHAAVHRVFKLCISQNTGIVCRAENEKTVLICKRNKPHKVQFDSQFRDSQYFSLLLQNEAIMPYQSLKLLKTEFLSDVCKAIKCAFWITSTRMHLVWVIEIWLYLDLSIYCENSTLNIHQDFSIS